MDAPAPDAAGVDAVLAAGGQPAVHLQPVVDLRSGDVWAVEALSRFSGHPRPTPDVWFRAAAALGRGVPLELHAVRRALGALELLPPRVRLTVNLSSAALQDEAVTELLLAVPAGRLVVELTEHEPVADYGVLLAALAPLRAAGVLLGIDDTGAGFATLRHVLTLEPDVVKIDVSLVAGLDADDGRQGLVTGLVRYCRSSRALLVAEGVEGPAELLALFRLGVSHGQGWFLGRPASVARVVASLGEPPVAPGDYLPAALTPSQRLAAAALVSDRLRTDLARTMARSRGLVADLG